MKRYNLINNSCGWAAFLVAAIVYCMTIEPTASLWDCAEFIITGYKLEVGHPPGAPFFMLMANVFSQFASDPSMVGMMVNLMSALISAACILFLFWSITHLTKKLFVDKNEELTLAQTIVIMGSGMVGALVYTFSDTFWFSAVEAEVYASSSLFTAVVFWLILKWEANADSPNSDRWLIFIAYLTGISIGVHLLNLLCLPAIVLVYYYKKNPTANAKGSLLALAGSFVLIAAILYGIVPGLVKVGGWFELFFVNTLGLPFNSGLIFYIFLLIGVIIWGVWESQRNTNDKRQKWAVLASVALLGIPFYGHGTSSIVIGLLVLGALAYYFFSKKVSKKYLPSARLLNTTMLCIMMIVIGYSSYAVIVIRSSANPPMDQNSPEDIFALGSFLNREQYGTHPLFYGYTFASQPKLVTEGNRCHPVVNSSTSYARAEKSSPNEPDRYYVIDGMSQYEYAQNMLLPRMHSSKPEHIEIYKAWSNFKGRTVDYDKCGQMVQIQVPTQLENIRFFLSYQLNFMYWRYFMWNFAGRQNDVQGHGEPEHGNWVTGFKWFDTLLTGNPDLLPDELKENKGYNVFYCMPLILGIFGLIFQAYRKERIPGAPQKGIQGFWIVFFLFFMTGIAIVLYLNQPPLQPRERDYAYAGSFYAFAIWIGMGVAAIYSFLQKRVKMPETVMALVTSVICLLVPIQMASQTWDDHDRSDRYACRDFGQNYLHSCQEEGNPIVFTYGDNDTFPLWYCQEVEGVRTDMKVCNLSYLQTDWYIDQMRSPSYDSPGVPIDWERIHYVEGTNTYVYIVPQGKSIIDEITGQDPALAEQLFGKEPYELSNILEHWIKNPAPQLREYLKQSIGEEIIFPTDSFYINVDKEAVRRSGMLIPKDSLGNEVPIPDRMTLSLKGRNGLTKAELMMLTMVAKSNWERPVYIAYTVLHSARLCFADYLIQEGLTLRFTPFKNSTNMMRYDAQSAYDNIMNKFKFGNVNLPHVYLDGAVLRMCSAHRNVMVQTAEALLMEGDKVKAKKMLDYSLEMLPPSALPFDYVQNSSGDMAELYYMLGDKAQGDSIIDALFKKSEQYIYWYLSLSGRKFEVSTREIRLHAEIYTRLLRMLEEYNPAKFQTYYHKFEVLHGLMQQRGISII